MKLHPQNPAHYMNCFRCSDPAHRAEWEQAQSWLLLGDAPRALASLSTEADGMSQNPEIEALRLLCLEQCQTPSADLGIAAVRALEKHGYVSRIYETAVIHLSSSGHDACALDLYLQYRHLPFPNLGEPLQNIACAAVDLGRHEDALRFVVEAVGTHSRPGDFLRDAQLTRLWSRLASTPPGQSVAQLLVSDAIHRLLSDARRMNLECSVCEFEKVTLVPPKFRPFLIRNPSSQSTMSPNAPADLRRRFGKWKEDRFRRNIRLLRRAIQGARQMLQLHTREPSDPSSTPTPSSTNI